MFLADLPLADSKRPGRYNDRVFFFLTPSASSGADGG